MRRNQIISAIEHVIENADGVGELHCSVLAEKAVKAAVKGYYDKNGIEYDHAVCASCDTARLGNATDLEGRVIYG